MKLLLFEPEALAEYRDAATYYASKNTEAALRFIEQVEAIVDPGHSEYELRFLLVGHSLAGHSLAGRALLVVHAEKDDTIRIISARRSTPRERQDYEAGA